MNARARERARERRRGRTCRLGHLLELLRAHPLGDELLVKVGGRAAGERRRLELRRRPAGGGSGRAAAGRLGRRRRRRSDDAGGVLDLGRPAATLLGLVGGLSHVDVLAPRLDVGGGGRGGRLGDGAHLGVALGRLALALVLLVLVLALLLAGGRRRRDDTGGGRGGDVGELHEGRVDGDVARREGRGGRLVRLVAQEAGEGRVEVSGRGGRRRGGGVRGLSRGAKVSVRRAGSESEEGDARARARRSTWTSCSSSSWAAGRASWWARHQGRG